MSAFRWRGRGCAESERGKERHCRIYYWTRLVLPSLRASALVYERGARSPGV